MKPLQSREETILSRTTLRPVEWLEGSPFTVPIRERFGSANRATRERNRYIELVLSILNHRPAGSFAGFRRPRGNGRLDRQAAVWDLWGAVPRDAGDQPQEVVKMAALKTGKTCKDT
jgi:hypothetical protein